MAYPPPPLPANHGQNGPNFRGKRGDQTPGMRSGAWLLGAKEQETILSGLPSVSEKTAACCICRGEGLQTKGRRVTRVAITERI